MEFRNLNWRNRIAWFLLIAVLMAGCAGPFDDFAYACTGIPPEDLDEGTLLLLIIIYAFVSGGSYTPPTEFGVAQTVEPQPGFAALRLRTDGSVVGMQPFNVNVRGTDAVVHPLARASARLDGAALAGRRIYFSDTDNDSVKVFDPVANAVAANVAVGGEPRGLAISPDGSRLYVGNRRSGTISVIDTAALDTLDPIRLPAGAEPAGVAITPDGRKLYVANEAGNGSVYSVDLSGGEAPTMIPTGLGANEVAVSPDGSLVYVTNNEAGNVVVLDVLTDAVVTALNVATPTGVVFSPDGAYVYVAGGGQVGRVFEYEVGGGPQPVREWTVGADPEGLAFSADGRVLVAANTGSDFISVIRPASDQPAAQINLREGFGALAILQPAP